MKMKTILLDRHIPNGNDWRVHQSICTGLKDFNKIILSEKQWIIHHGFWKTIKEWDKGHLVVLLSDNWFKFQKVFGTYIYTLSTHMCTKVNFSADAALSLNFGNTVIIA